MYITGAWIHATTEIVYTIYYSDAYAIVVVWYTVYPITSSMLEI
jgi:hypothetical protein